mmetsp:Transcript_62937/g.126211  ORF Transcript_62937/g.126211 Transcript_62937/m.126211 type:complete len:323 (-) Transcript_62937:254-1222(-)
MSCCTRLLSSSFSCLTIPCAALAWSHLPFHAMVSSTCSRAAFSAWLRRCCRDATSLPSDSALLCFSWLEPSSASLPLPFPCPVTRSSCALTSSRSRSARRYLLLASNSASSATRSADASSAKLLSSTLAARLVGVPGSDLGPDDDSSADASPVLMRSSKLPSSSLAASSPSSSPSLPNSPPPVPSAVPTLRPPPVTLLPLLLAVSLPSERPRSKSMPRELPFVDGLRGSAPSPPLRAPPWLLPTEEGAEEAGIALCAAFGAAAEEPPPKKSKPPSMFEEPPASPFIRGSIEEKDWPNMESTDTALFPPPPAPPLPSDQRGVK